MTKNLIYWKSINNMINLLLIQTV